MTGAAYDDAVEYLVRYATDDWMMMSVVVSEARIVAGAAATKTDVANVALDLVASLMGEHVVPGDLEADFEPWPGSREQRIARLRTELDAMVARDELPVGPEICWFHTVVS